MWAWLASFLGGPIVNGLIDAYKAKLVDTNTQDRTAADLTAKDIEAEIEARKQASVIIIAGQGYGVPHLTQKSIAPDETFAYEYTCYDAGTFWYPPADATCHAARNRKHSKLQG